MSEIEIGFTDMEAEAVINAIDVYSDWMKTTRDWVQIDPKDEVLKGMALVGLGECYADSQAVRTKLVEGLGYDPHEGIEDPTRVQPPQ